MARRGKNRRAKRSPSVVLVFGENLNDSVALAELIQALCPSLRGRVKARPKPLSLQRNADPSTVRSWIEQIAAVVRAESGDVACVFVHRDSDQPDPSGTLEASTNEALRATGLDHAHAVVPVVEIESWWLVFPEATESVRSSWRGQLKAAPGNSDSVADPKEELIRRTRKGAPKNSYSEADSRAIAQAVADLLRGGAKPAGVSPSFERFAESFGACCDAVG